jgi:hypothetical protein
MAKIKINDIETLGLELFADSESFMTSLSDDEINHIQGGGPKTCCTCNCSCKSEA